MHPSLTLHLRFHSAGQKHTSKNFSAGGVLAGEETQTINNYPEKYVAHMWRELSHELSNFYWKFLLDMTTMVWIYISFIEDVIIHWSFFFFQDSM